MRLSHPWWFHFLPVVTALLLPLWVYPHVRNALRFPLRVVIGILLILAIYLFIRDSVWLVHRIADQSRGWAESWRGMMERHGKWLKRLEVLVAGVVLILAAVSAFQNLLPMWSSSLKTDEIGAITRYSSKGAAYSMHNYDLAKNHIFFSVVNAITPGASSYHPARARFWSMLAVLTGLSLLAWEFIRRGEYMAGALAVSFPANTPWLLSLLYEGRGYAFVALAALICLLAVQRRWESPDQTGGLVVLSIAVVLGTFTLPFFVLFGGVLLLAVFFHHPTRQTFLAGWLSLAAVFGLYSQVMGPLLSVASEYDENYDAGFTQFEDALRILNYSIPSELMRVNTFLFFAIVAAVLLLPVFFRGLTPARVRVLQTGFGLVVFFAAVCLFLESPPPRITSFLAFPLALCAGLLLSAVLNSSGMLPLRPLVVLALGAVLTQAGIQQIRGYEFYVPARWREAGSIIGTAFPANMAVITPEYQNNLKAYVPNERALQKGVPDWSDVIGGRIIAFDPSHKTDHQRLQPPVEGVRTIPLPNHLSEQAIYFGIREEDRLSATRTIGTRMSYQIDLPADSERHSLNLLAAQSWPPRRDMQIHVTHPDGKTKNLGSRDFLVIENILSIPMASVPPGSRVIIELPAGELVRELQDIWASRSIVGD